MLAVTPYSTSFSCLAREKVYVDVRAPTLAKARVARALLVTHLKSRSELLRLEQKRRALEGSLSAFEVGVDAAVDT